MAARKPLRAGNSPAYQWIRAACGLKSNLTDQPGSQRFWAGGTTEGLWDYAPQTPTMPVGSRVRPHVWTFNSPADLVTDAVSATEYKFKQTASGSGTPLAAADVVGGGAKFTNGASDNNYYFYESGAEIAQLVPGYDLWFEIILQVSDATQSDMFAGLCARLASGNLFDNRVDCVGFKKDDGDAYIDLETDVSGSAATNVNAEGTLVNNTPISLGLHYRGDLERVFFYIDDTCVHDIATTLPTTEMCVSFGLRNGEAVAKSMTVHGIFLLVAVAR